MDGRPPVHLAHATGRILHAAITRSGISLEPETRAIKLLGSLVGLFFLGGIIGAMGFQHLGTLFALPLASIPLLLAAVPIADDVRRFAQPDPLL